MNYQTKVINQNLKVEKTTTCSLNLFVIATIVIKAIIIIDVDLFPSSCYNLI